MNLELAPEIEARLLSQARDMGLTPEAYAAHVLGERVLGASEAVVDEAELSPDEWMRRYRAWAHSHDADHYPALTLEAMSRDSIYE